MDSYFADAKLRNLIIAVVFIFVFLVTTVNVISGSLFGILLVGGVTAFFVFNVLLPIRKYWLVMALGLCLVPAALPLPILNRFTVGLLFGIFLWLIQLADTAMQHHGRADIPSCFADRLMMLVAVVITVRVLWDRPGSVHMGESGGLGEAIWFFVGILLYFMLRRQAWTCEFSWRQCSILLLMALVGFIWPFVAWVLHSGGGFYRGWFFHYSMWLMGPLVIARVVYRYEGKMNWRVIVLGLVYLALSIVSPHRSRVVFALCSLVIMGLIYRRARQAFVILTILVTALAFWIMGRGYENLPVVVQRPLSTLADLLGGSRDSLSRKGELGFSSGFRKTMYMYGWEQIKKHPLVGRGASLSREELIAQLNSSNYMYGSLALSGKYHNSYFQLAVQYGVPAMLMFTLATCLIIFPFFKWARDRANANGRMWAAMIVGFFSGIMGQTLFNGGGEMFYCVCLLLGTMRGMMLNPLLLESAPLPATPESLPAPRRVGSLLASHAQSGVRRSAPTFGRAW